MLGADPMSDRSKPIFKCPMSLEWMGRFPSSIAASPIRIPLISFSCRHSSKKHIFFNFYFRYHLYLSQGDLPRAIDTNSDELKLRVKEKDPPRRAQRPAVEPRSLRPLPCSRSPRPSQVSCLAVPRGSSFLVSTVIASTWLRVAMASILLYLNISALSSIWVSLFCRWAWQRKICVGYTSWRSAIARRARSPGRNRGTYDHVLTAAAAHTQPLCRHDTCLHIRVCFYFFWRATRQENTIFKFQPKRIHWYSPHWQSWVPY